jgi:hypothetical protein
MRTPRVTIDSMPFACFLYVKGIGKRIAAMEKRFGHFEGPEAPPAELERPEPLEHILARDAIPANATLCGPAAAMSRRRHARPEEPAGNPALLVP